ncbi:MAG: glycerophosphodiester phosphodiesterase [Thermomicrobiales bacterium]
MPSPSPRPPATTTATLLEAIPGHRPLAIAHRAGNHAALAERAIAHGADLLETDVWLHRDILEVRHDERVTLFGWSLPLLHDGWRLHWMSRSLRRIESLLDETPIDARLFLDLKGTSPALGVQLVAWINEHHPERHIIVCGRSWDQLDAIEALPNVVAIYSVGDEGELAAFWDHVGRLDYPAISLNHRLATPDVMERLKAMHALVICWTVNDAERMETLRALGVDGVTTDRLDLIDRIVRERTPVPGEEARSA